jgi:hypothetical protein
MADQELQKEEEKRGPGRPPNPKPVEPVTIPIEQVQAMMQMLIAESRKPVRDPIKEQQTARMKEHNRQGLKDQRDMKIAKFQNCNHMQRPGSILTGCSAIAWATQSDGITRGFCQHCGTGFSPRKEECISQEIWEAYKHLIRIPTHPAGNVSYTFQNA